MESKTISDNELIVARFMGLRSREVGPEEHKHTVWYKDNDFESWFSFPEYQTSWNALMPVIGKIRHVLQDNALYDKARRHWDFITVALETVEIKAVYIAVIEFIKWYNSNSEETK